jgi:hypothetical protein
VLSVEEVEAMGGKVGEGEERKEKKRRKNRRKKVGGEKRGAREHYANYLGRMEKGDR